MSGETSQKSYEDQREPAWNFVGPERRPMRPGQVDEVVKEVFFFFFTIIIIFIRGPLKGLLLSFPVKTQICFSYRFPGTWCWSSLFPPLCALSDATGWREASDPHHSCPLWLGCPFYGSLKPGILHGPPRRSPCHVASESQRPTLLLPVGQSWTFPQHETF